LYPIFLTKQTNIIKSILKSNDRNKYTKVPKILFSGWWYYLKAMSNLNWLCGLGDISGSPK
jgi:hypothetical protein